MIVPPTATPHRNFGNRNRPPLWEIWFHKIIFTSKTITMINAQFIQSTSTSAASDLPSVSLLEFCKHNACKPSKVILTRENKYKALVFTNLDNQVSCVMLGKRSSERVSEGDAPLPTWNIVQLPDGKLRISIQESIAGFEELGF